MKKQLQNQIETTETKLTKTNSVDQDRIFTNKQLQNLLNVSRKTCQHWRDCRIITFSQVGKLIFYRMSDIHEMLDNHKQLAEKIIV
ncbi:helix-turn-helix domain-containing protein [Saprospiraceae bacterium]|nr:helix-turn-helix domain-containing protein [Saprospiraceae bacterium]